MAKAKELFDAGDLRGAIEEVTREVKAQPTEMRLRTFLFELLCFAGDFDRAERQLDVIAQQSARAEIGVQVYRNNIKAERDRVHVFADSREPHFLIEPPPYVDMLIEGVKRLCGGEFAAARESFDRAEEERPALAGSFNGQMFGDFRDSDDRIGGVLELFVQDQYTWLAFEQIRRLEIPAPKQLRDLMWAPARVHANDGTIGEVYIPALYVGSNLHEDDRVKLGRMSDWKNIGNGIFLGYGLRVFLRDSEDTAIFEARSLEFDPHSAMN